MRHARILLAAIAMVAASLLPVGSASAYTCHNQYSYIPTNINRSWDQAYGVLGARGVTANVYVPGTSEIGLPNNSDDFSFGGLHLYYNGDFVRMGWIKHKNMQPYVLMEELNRMTGEIDVHIGPVLTPGGYNKMSMVRIDNPVGTGGHYEYRLNGVAIDTTTWVHMLSGRPASVAIITDICVRMLHYVQQETGPNYSTLYYVNTGSTTWSAFPGDVYSVDGPQSNLLVYGSIDGDPATHFAIGGGP